MITYDGDLSQSLWAEFEIDYDYDRPERDHRGHLVCPGNINLHDVRVLWVEGYDRNGRTVYSLNRASIEASKLVVLDRVAYNYVQDSIDNWDMLAEHLVECAE